MLDPDDPRTKLLEKIAICAEESKEKLVLCGGMAAFLLCERAKADADVVFTEDADLLIKRREHAEKDFKAAPVILRKVLIKEGFEPETVSYPIAETGKGLSGEHWHSKEFAEFYVEFLTEDHNKEKHSISGITAQGLSYFSMSLNHSFSFELPSGRKINVVSPDAFIMHKVLTFNLRPKPAKSFKDLYYISFVGKSVYSSPEQISRDIALFNIHDKWRSKAEKNLKTIEGKLEGMSASILANDASGYLIREDLSIYLAPNLYSLKEKSGGVPSSISEICGNCHKFLRVIMPSAETVALCIHCDKNRKV